MTPRAAETDGRSSLNADWKTRILVVEDEAKSAESLRAGLTEEGFEVDVARRGDEGLLRARTGAYDLIVLDVMLPHRDGWEVMDALRQEGGGPPVLFLTARDGIEDRVRGLELGADDYLVKPFAFAELRARIRALLRRGPVRSPERISVEDLQVDLVQRRATRGTHVLNLTQREFDLLKLLVLQPGVVLSRDTLAREVWGMEAGAGSSAIEVAIHRLRSKVDLGGEARSLVHTVRGVGYVLEAR